MTSSSPRDLWRALGPSMSVGMIGIAFVACTLESAPGTTEGQTTTTYGGTNASAGPDDGDPSDVTDDGAPDETTSSDPSDSDTDPSADDSGTFPCDFGVFSDLPPPDGAPNGTSCTSDFECSSGNCYVLPFLGGFCGECNEDADCVGGGCSAPNPFDSSPPVCNIGELGAGCESDDVCSGDLSCSNVLDLLGLIQLNTCGVCVDDFECDNQICAAYVELSQFAGQRMCIDPYSMPQNAYCELEFNGNEACASGICSVVDVMGLAELGACGECTDDSHCNGGVCVAGELVLETGTLLGSTCQ